MRISALVALVGLVVAALGCGGALGTARTITIATGDAVAMANEALDQARPALVERFHAQAAAMPEGQQRQEYERLTRPLVVASDAVDVLTRGWMAIDAAWHAWDEGRSDQGSWQRLAMCGVAALANLVDALRAARIPPPDLVVAAARDLGEFAGRMCGTIPGAWQEHHQGG